MSAPIYRLSNYPWVVVRISCPTCRRSGRYRLARLAQRFGAEITLDELLEHFTADCRYRRRPGERSRNQYHLHCKARFTDIEASPRAPGDLPAEGRRMWIVRSDRG